MVTENFLKVRGLLGILAKKHGQPYPHSWVELGPILAHSPFSSGPTCYIVVAEYLAALTEDGHVYKHVSSFLALHSKWILKRYFESTLLLLVTFLTRFEFFKILRFRSDIVKREKEAFLVWSFSRWLQKSFHFFRRGGFTWDPITPKVIVTFIGVHHLFLFN